MGVINRNISRPQYKLYTLLCMFYTIILAETVVMMFKLISIDTIIESGSILFIPIMYIIEDAIAEVYGYKAARRLILFSIIATAVFCIMIQITIALPSPAYWHKQAAFNLVLGNVTSELIIGTIAMIAGELLNIYLITKWKSLLGGRHFWIRSIASTSIGELLQSIIVYTGNFHNLLKVSGLEHLIISAYLYKVGAAVVLVVPGYIFVRFLKNIEKIDIYDNKVKFNPFIRKKISEVS